MSEPTRTVEGTLAHRINSDDATWYIDESKDDGRSDSVDFGTVLIMWPGRPWYNPWHVEHNM